MSKSTPQATILFLAYNQQDFVAQASQACLEQQGGPFEIIFSDDASSDNTYAILQHAVAHYHGPHTVVVRQNSRNLGVADHYNTLIKLAQCELLITAAGDDISYPERAQTLLAAWHDGSRKLDLLASYAQSITHDGQNTGQTIQVDQLSDWRSAAQWCAKRPYVVGATHAFTKRIWTEFGDIDSDITYEDQIMTLRALCLGGAATIPTALVSYRQGGLSAKVRSTNSDQKRLALYKRYSRQRSVFSQIHKDLKKVGLDHLWSGKVKQYLDRAQAALHLLQCQSSKVWPSMGQVWLMIRQCGIFWTLRQYIYTFRR